MVDGSIKYQLIDKQKDSDLNFTDLLKFMEESDIDFKDKKLKGPLGMATDLGVYLDLTKLNQFSDNFLFYVILHETAHCKRINRIGITKVVEKFTLDNFDDFCDYVIDEEIVADRYASLIYLLLNNKLYPKNATQQLENKSNQEKYKTTARYMFGIVKNKEDYKKLWESFIEYEVQ